MLHLDIHYYVSLIISDRKTHNNLLSLFISWIFHWVLTSLYPLQVCSISWTRFKEFRKFWPCSFVDTSVKGNGNFWKVRGLIDGFNELHRHIASGVEKRQMSR